MKVRIQGSTPVDRWFEGYVHFVKQMEVGLRFHSSFNYRKGQLCDVHFELGRFPIRRMHQAMDRPFLFDRVLFPNASHFGAITPPTLTEVQTTRRTVVNRLIADNLPQLTAISAIKNRKSGTPPFVIWGP